MLKRLAFILIFSTFLVNCSVNLLSLESASENYKHSKDYVSLEVIHKNISQGMQRKQVEQLLGDPDYSPIDGQYYYSSSQSSFVEDDDREVSIGLVVDYRNTDNVVTETLQKYWLGPLGE